MHARSRSRLSCLRDALLASWLVAVSGSVPAAVVDVDQLPSREQLLRDLGGLHDVQPGVKALEKGDFVAAARFARGYIERNPTDPRPHLLLVLTWYGQEDDGRIDRHLDDIDAQFPALGAAMRETVASLYLRDRRLYRAARQLAAIPPPRRTDQGEFLAAAIADRQGRLAEARVLLVTLGARLPDNVTLAISEARLALKATDYDSAAAAAGRALRTAPNLEAALLLLGAARMQQGRPAEALKAFNGILARNPGHGSAALSVGLIHLSAGRNADAIKSFRMARSLGAGDARPYLGEAAAAFVANDPAMARAAIATGRKQNPEDPTAALVDLLIRGPAAREPAAATARTAAGRFFPDLHRAPVPTAMLVEIADTASARRLAVANVLAQGWSGGAALAWLGKPTPGEGPMTSLTRARALASLGKWEEADRLLAALQESPSGEDLVGPLAQSAGIAAARKDGPRALSQLRDAVRLAPDTPSLRVALGDLCNSLGMPAEAAAAYRAALETAPRDPRLLNQLAAALALLGDKGGLEEGLRLVDRAIQQKSHYLTGAQLRDTRADLLYRLDRTSEALVAYRELSGIVGGMRGPIPWHQYGELALAAGDRSVAKKAFERALDSGRDYPRRSEALQRVAALSKPTGP